MSKGEELKRIWEKVLEMVRQRGKGTLLDAYLTSSSPLRLTPESLIVRVPNQFTREKLEREFARQMLEALNAASSQPRVLRYEIGEDPEKSDKSPGENGRRSVEDIAASAEASVQNLLHAANLNPEYVFSRFIVGKTYMYPHAIAKSVSASPGKVYNPVYYYGGVGLGKTHLMQAIGHEVLKNNPRARVLYVTSEVFHNEYIDYIQNRKPWDQFRKKYRDIDCLLLDDVQFLESGERIQEEFFHTFEALKNRGKQIVLTCDKNAHQLEKMHERLRSRFASGVVADIILPDEETRMAILSSQAREEHVAVPDEVVRYIAEKVCSNVRELRAVFRGAVAKASVLSLPLSIPLVDEVLRATTGPKKPREISIQMIQDEACAMFGLSLEDLTGRRRDRRVVLPRQIAMFLARELAGRTLMEIGQAFGKKDHTTVMHSCSKIEDEMKSESNLKENVERLRIRLREKLE